MDRPEYISMSLLYRKFTGIHLSEKEEREFDCWYGESEEHRLFYKRFCVQQEKIMTRDRSVVDVQKRLAEVKRKGRVKQGLNWWRLGRVAAAALIAFVVGWMCWPEKGISDVPMLVQAKPGKAAVVLRLGQGEQIVLDSTSIMQTINKDCVSIQVGAGILEYKSDPVAGEGLIYNELVVPPSGEYIVVLADGTKVYLNSVSTLRYPTVFSAHERRVELSGEAYFVVSAGEVPFIVETKMQEIKVYGTEFNVMTYEDEAVAQTTLVKGSVGVLVKGKGSGHFQKLVPGEQFVLNQQTKESEIMKVDVYSYMVWKDGLFVAQNDNLETILRKVARWFDVEIFYQNPGLMKKRFYGMMKRQTSLQEVLDVIAEAGDVQFKVNGRTVMVGERK